MLSNLMLRLVEIKLGLQFETKNLDVNKLCFAK